MSVAHILLVGCGKMGTALLSGWLDSPAVGRVVIVKPSGGEIPPQSDGRVVIVPDAALVPVGFAPEVVVFAVKPQMMAEVLPLYHGFIAAGAVALSIAAGKTIKSFAQVFGSAAIIRAMPNTPSAIGRGISALVANDRANPAQRALADTLLRAVGRVVWLEDEGLMDAVTAVSGSGPAYLFLMIEALAAAGEAAGLPQEMAVTLARETLAGAAELALKSSEDAAQLRRNVTSPKGTTEAALRVLMAEDGLPGLLRRAVDAAILRSRELAG